MLDLVGPISSLLRQQRCEEAHELEEPLAALMSSSARHSEMVLMLRKADSRAPVVSR